jgi:hypothetical protein
MFAPLNKYSTKMKTKVKIPPTEIKRQIVGVKLSDREISKIKTFCSEHKVSQSNLIRYAIRYYIPDL